MQDHVPGVLVEDGGTGDVANGHLPAVTGGLRACGAGVVDEGEEVRGLPTEPGVLLQAQQSALGELHIAHGGLGDLQHAAQPRAEDRAL
ncbi:hypothetical protein [Streptomyces sp. NPDC007856]|uniref:hypothetical protein n=1 Tax=Streptomyces sp. NPDC007856 TaxID=3364781 RepID=UPI0036C6BF00